MKITKFLFTVFETFSRTGKIRLISLVFLQMVLTLLDIIGLLLLGAVTALSVSQYDKSAAPRVVKRLIEVLNLDSLSFTHQISILLGLVAVFFLSKTFFSVIILRRIYAVLANQDVFFGQSQTLGLFKKPHSQLRKYNSQDLVFALSSAVGQTIFGVVGNVITLITEIGFVILLFLSLSFTNFLLTVFTVIYFLLAGWIFHRLAQERLHKLSSKANELSIALNTNILEGISLLRELYLRNDYEYISERINTRRASLADTRAKLSLWPNLSKYYVEITFILGLFGVMSLSFLVADPKAALPSLAIFIAGSSRAIPSLLRIQMALIAISQNEPGARFSLEITSGVVDSLRQSELQVMPADVPFIGSVSLRDVTFGFDKSNPIFYKASLEIEPGEFVSVIGKSGAGKSTLVDLILGFLTPTEGDVRISGMSPSNAEHYFPGAIALVPQQIVMLDANIVENITLEIGIEKEEDLAHAINSAAIDFVYEGDRDLMKESIGENGRGLSGGQRQRVGLARALYTNPKLLILDEATSALDAITESQVRRQIQKLRGVTTIILIAHKLETLKMADRIVLLEDSVFREITLQEVQENSKKYLQQ